MSPLAHPALAGDLTALADRLRASTVAVHVGTPMRRGLRPAGQGSGVVWQADGLVVTNAHVARADHAVVTLPDARRVAARVIARDPGRDLALLQVDADGLTPATPGDATALAPGALVFAFGHPLGHANALAAGVLHAMADAHPPWARGPAANGPRARVALVQADVRLLPGNSGGPLADAAGHVLGINAMVVNGLGVAIATREVTRLVERHASATTATPRLGIALRPVRVRTPGTRDERPALLVLEVARGSAADRAALLPGDVLLAADGAPLATADDLVTALRRAARTEVLTLDLGRAGRQSVRHVPLDPPGVDARAA
jgi:serine protease Do